MLHEVLKKSLKWMVPCVGVFAIAACSQKSDNASKPKFDSGMPSIDKIVADSTPAGLTATSFMPFGEVRLMTAISDYASFKGWIQERFFNDCEANGVAGCSGVTYYRRNVKQLDDTINSMEARFETVPECFAGEASASNKATFSLGGHTEDFYFSCWENISGGSGTQKAAYGKTATHFYMMRTISNSATSGMVMIAKADIAGNIAEVWSVARSGSDITTTRAIANRTALEMSYYFGTTEVNNWNGLCHFFGRTDGTALYFDVERDSSGSCVSTGITVPGGTADAGAGCVLADDIDTTSSGCGSINTAPSGFGLTVTNNTTMPTTSDFDAIIGFDLATVASQLP